MDEIKSSSRNDDVDEEQFEDAFDEFPFYDCKESFHERNESDDADVSSIASNFASDSKPSPEKSPTGNLRRRRYTSRSDSQSPSSSVSFEKSYGNSRESSMFRFSEKLKEIEEDGASFSQNSGNLDEIKLNSSSRDGKVSESEGFDEESGSVLRDLAKLDGIKLNLSSGDVVNGHSEGLDEENKENSTVTRLNNEKSDEFSEGNSNLGETHNGDSSFLIFLAGLVIRAIGFQFNLFIYFVTFPVWVIYGSYMFIMDPFRVMKRGKEYLFRKVFGIWGSVLGNTSAFVYEWFKEHQSLLKLGLKLGWGFLWSVYVCVILVGLLVSAFVVGGILMNVVVEEPIKIRENLNFDYTEKSPTAFVPIIGCSGQDCGVECNEKLDVMKFDAMRVIPLDHKLQATVSLKLPESDYNRNLGIFQVRVDFLAPDGKALSSSRHPCMLQFKSEPIRLLLTFLKVAPLLTGYTSESQDLNIKFKGFIEGVKPTACLRVTIEQRAQFASGEGIPEIYAASLILESEQPLLKRIVWYWRKTLFIWISMTMFTVELLFTLLCCKSIIVPRVRLGDNSAGDGVPRSNGPHQR